MAIIATCLMLFFSLARGQEVHHHEGMSPEVDRFYSTWYMPDQPNKTCCNKQDCYPTVVKFERGQWWALRREDGRYIPVPWKKVELNRDNPDGRNHLCAPPPPVGRGDEVFCFSLGTGG